MPALSRPAHPPLTLPAGCGCGCAADDLCVCGWQGSLCATLAGLPAPFGMSYACAMPNGSYTLAPLFSPPSTVPRAWSYSDPEWCVPDCIGGHLFSILVECGEAGGYGPFPLMATVNLACGVLSHTWELRAPDPLTAEDCGAGITLTSDCRARAGAGTWFDCDDLVSLSIVPGDCGVGFAAPAGAARRVPLPCLYLGEKLTAVERIAARKSHLRDWRWCGAGLGPVCRCAGCGPSCPKYLPDPSAPDL